MNSQQREIYVVLTKEIDTILCSACRYSSGGDCCTEPDCDHKLKDHIKFPFQKRDGFIEPGQDCWGFRPALSVEHLADIAGLVLAHGWDEWFWRVYKDGTIKVFGRDSSKVEVKS